ncbi:MAG: diguanylate cyclase (GGDEF)-like protein [Enterobacterales bacterium]|jgi:diguanylate cyclase (GGDEF)-like protein
MVENEGQSVYVDNALELLNTPVWIWDLEAQRVLWANPSAVALWGLKSLEELTLMDFTNEPLCQEFRKMAERFRYGETVEEEQTFTMNGRPSTVTCQCQGIEVSDYNLAALVEVRQVSSSPMDSNIQSSIEALQHTPAMVSLHRIDGVAIMRNPAAMRCFGFLDPKSPDSILDRISDPQVTKDFLAALDKGMPFTEELMTETRQGPRWHHFDARIILNENNHRVVLINELDIHQRKSAADAAHKLAYFDSLTNLPNRVAFSNRINDILLGLLHVSEQSAVVVYINAINFSDVNSTFGFAAGDKLLIDIGSRLSESLPDVEIVSRIGSDKFAVAQHINYQAESLQQLIKKILEIFDVPFNVLEHSYLVGIRMGVSLMPEHAQTETEASRVTDIALNHTKNKGRNSWVLYNQRMTIATTEKTQRVQQLYEAMAKGHFMLYFQPQVELKTGRVIGAETLLRWRTEDGIFISPAEFIPLAEQMGVINDITRWIIREACRLNKTWCNKGFGRFRIAVNISGSEFADDNFIDVVRLSLEHTGLDPELLELEVTETALVNDMGKATETLHKLKALGVELAIDDFGTGHSSLSYLKEFPVDRLKIDKAFIDHVHESKADLAIVRTIVGLAQALDLSIIAEGIEYKEQADILRDEGCDEGQGYYFSKPMPVSEFEAYLIREYSNENSDEESNQESIENSNETE